jgi:hypothetical protein
MLTSTAAEADGGQAAQRSWPLFERTAPVELPLACIRGVRLRRNHERSQDRHRYRWWASLVWTRSAKPKPSKPTNH